MKDESGWTLPEMLLGLVLSLGIAASSLVILQTALRSQRATGSRLAAQDDGTFAMLRMTKDIRSATAATVQDARTMDLQVPQRNRGGGAPVSVHVRYACAGSSCTRLVCGTPFVSNSCEPPVSAIVVAAGVANGDNFRGRLQPAPDHPVPRDDPGLPEAPHRRDRNCGRRDAPRVRGGPRDRHREHRRRAGGQPPGLREPAACAAGARDAARAPARGRLRRGPVERLLTAR
jgi:hypothetical protein